MSRLFLELFEVCLKIKFHGGTVSLHFRAQLGRWTCLSVESINGKEWLQSIARLTH